MAPQGGKFGAGLNNVAGYTFQLVTSNLYLSNCLPLTVYVSLPTKASLGDGKLLDAIVKLPATAVRGAKLKNNPSTLVSKLSKPVNLLPFPANRIFALTV